ncbi:MAG: UDP-N-acetylmuramate dehydrogenase, partial [Pyrinomonadaceae bacterium]
ALKGIGVEKEFAAQDVEITVQAGEDWDEFVRYCVEQDLAGVECLSGIPGLIGGTPIQNVGAYGQEVSETIVAVRCFDREALEFTTLPHGDCGFEYRKSLFNTIHQNRYIVLEVTFRLKRGGEPRVNYKDLRELFAERKPSLREVRDAVLTVRRAKSMVIDNDDPNSQSAGSFFKNPIVTAGKLEQLQAAHGVIPYFDSPEGMAKIPAAWLIENSGFNKGFILGNAGISTKHTLALINRGNATAAEMLALKEAIQNGVNEKFGIQLQPEPVFIGFT